MSSPTLWYYHKDGRGFGPLQEADIGGLLKHNEIAADTLVWRDGLSNWTEAQSTELINFSSDGAFSPPVSFLTTQGLKDSKISWFVFIPAEILNCLIFGLIPLFAALVLSVSGTSTGH
jgi:GYF domain 2